MPDLDIFWLEFEINIVTFAISTLEFVKLQNFGKKQKYLNVSSKMPNLSIFDKKSFIRVFLGYN